MENQMQTNEEEKVIVGLSKYLQSQRAVEEGQMFLFMLKTIFHKYPVVKAGLVEEGIVVNIEKEGETIGELMFNLDLSSFNEIQKRKHELSKLQDSKAQEQGNTTGNGKPTKGGEQQELFNPDIN